MEIIPIEIFRKRYKYDVETEDDIGDGSTGNVFRAYDTEKQEYVAIKQVHIKKSEKDRYTLENEVFLANTIKDIGNIAQYYECHRLKTDTGYVDVALMKFYEMGNLKQFLKENTLSDDTRNELIAGLLNGLEQVHKHNIIHRDLKPENILIAKIDDRIIPKIADFGISKKSERIENSAISNSIVGGTISYSSPEQILEYSDTLKFNTDLWSLGVIIYEIFTGYNPFLQDVDKTTLTKEEIRRIILSKIRVPVLPADISKIPQPYKEIIENCIIADPSLRIKSVDLIRKIIEKYEFNDLIAECINEFEKEEYAKAKQLLFKIPRQKWTDKTKFLNELLTEDNLFVYNELLVELKTLPSFLSKKPTKRRVSQNKKALSLMAGKYLKWNEQATKIILPHEKMTSCLKEVNLWVAKYKEALENEGEDTVILKDNDNNTPLSWLFLIIVVAVILIGAVLLIVPPVTHPALPTEKRVENVSPTDKADSIWTVLIDQAAELEKTDSLQKAIDILKQAQNIKSTAIAIQKIDSLSSKRKRLLQKYYIELPNAKGGLECDGEKIKLLRKIVALDTSLNTPHIKSNLNRCN